MNALQGYGSDSSDDNDCPAARTQSLKKVANTRSNETLDYDPKDAFGLNGLQKDPKSSDASEQASSSVTTSNQSPASARPNKKRKSSEASQHASSSNAVASAAVAPSASSPSQSSTTAVTLTPKVIDNSSASEALLLRPGDTTMHVNIPYADMTAPVYGPSNPFSSHQSTLLGAQQNTLSGHIENAAMSDFDFRNQQRTFDVYGYAKDPTIVAQHSDAGPSSFVGDMRAATQFNGSSALELRTNQSAKFKTQSRQLKKNRNKGSSGDPSILDGEGAYVGPWAKWDADSSADIAQQQAEAEASGLGPTASEQAAAEALSVSRAQQKLETEEARRKESEAEADGSGGKRGTEKSIFHGKSMYDYQGRTYMHIPTDVDVNLSGESGSQECYLPKRCIHVFKGHTKGISALRLFPGSGHLMLSSSMDTKVKLWDLYHEGRPCLRTFLGHSKAVKDVCFSNDGKRFLSAGYDRQIKLWDTETGACLSSFTNGKFANCITFHPSADKQNIFLAGMSDKKVIQVDMNSWEVTQEYAQHLGPVNSINFIDDNRRFVTTSDDKTIRGWDYDIPVVIKYISDPTMHSVPTMTLHSNAKWLLGQSMDNQILTFSTLEGSLKMNRKKVFRGHNVAGYSCQIGVSPDGRFISSGDGDGNLVFWDWKSTKLVKRIRNAHKDPLIAQAWLPHESSKVVTGGWDGDIKLWD